MLPARSLGRCRALRAARFRSTSVSSSRRPPLLAVQVLWTAPRVAQSRSELASQVAHVQGAAATHPFETGTLAHELLAGFVAVVDTSRPSAGKRSRHTNARSAAVPRGLPDRLHALRPVHDGRAAFDICVQHGRPHGASRCGAPRARDIAGLGRPATTAVEIMQRLGLGEAAQ